MRDRGKAKEAYGGDLFSHANNLYSSSSCKKHPSSCPIGVCAYCLRDRLVELLCSDCGEQRLSYCSCSESAVLKRSSSSSSSVEIKRSAGLWKLFMKKSVPGDEKSEMWVADYRSRSLCSFRGTNLYGSEAAAVRRSGFSEAEPRRSGYGYNSEAEPTKSGFDDLQRKTNQTGPNVAKPRIFSLKKTGLSSHSGFIDLQLDFSNSAATESKTEYPIASEGESRRSFKGWSWIFKKCDKGR